MEHEADEEKLELKWIYMDKGLTEQEADMVVSRLLTNKKKFFEDMLSNELHVHGHNLRTHTSSGRSSASPSSSARPSRSRHTISSQPSPSLAASVVISLSSFSSRESGRGAS